MAKAIDTRAKIGEAMMALAGEKSFAEIGLPEIAERAGISLGALREAYDGKAAILSDIARAVDVAVLSAAKETTEESARDRLFDLIMRRFDALAPMKAGVRGLAKAARREPVLAMALHANTLVSMRWMIEAADLPGAGLRRAIKIEGLAAVYLSALRTWISDDDPDLAKTMATLDAGLRRGEAVLARLDKVTGFFSGLAPKEWSRRRTAADPEVRESEATP